MHANIKATEANSRPLGYSSTSFPSTNRIHECNVVLIGIALQITLESADIVLRDLVKAIPSSTTGEANEETKAYPNASPSVYQLCVCADSGKIFTAPPDKPCAANETICGPKHTTREQLSRDYTRLQPVEWLKKAASSSPFESGLQLRNSRHNQCFSSRLLFRSMFALMHFCF